jgi:hypothetical protein
MESGAAPGSAATSTSGTGGGGREDRILGLAPRRQWLLTILVAFSLLTGWGLSALWHPAPRPDDPASLGFWIHGGPTSGVLADRRLADVGCDLNSVYAGPGSGEVWIAGNWGLFLHGRTSGNSAGPPGGWTQEPLAPPPGAIFRLHERPGLPSKATGWLDAIDGLPAAYGRETPPPPPPASKAQFPAAQWSPPPSATSAMPATTPSRAPRPPASTVGHGGAPSGSAQPPPSQPSVSAPPAASPSSAPIQQGSQQSATHSPALQQVDPPQLIGIYLDPSGGPRPLGDDGRLYSSREPAEPGAVSPVVGRFQVGGGVSGDEIRGVHVVGDSSAQGASSTVYAVGASRIYRRQLQRRLEADGRVLLVGTAPWTPLSRPTGGLNGIWFVSDRRGFVVGDQGAIFRTDDGGASWLALTSGTRAALYGVSFGTDGQEGWTVGASGTVLHTTDGGGSWARWTRGDPGEIALSLDRPASLPPLYWIGAALLALALVPAYRQPPTQRRSAISDSFWSDAATATVAGDALDFERTVRGLSRFLRNANTEPPLTVAVTGEWGSGKTSLMKMLESELSDLGFRPVWFDAWHHQKEEHLLVALLQSVRESAVPEWWHPHGWIVRGRLTAIRAKRYALPLTGLAFVLFLAAGYEQVHHDGIWKSLSQNSQLILQALKDRSFPGIDWGFLSLLGSLFTSAAALWSGATPFKTQPARLFSAVANSGRVKDLEARTSFRQRFAVEFGDVTAALAPRKLPVFIDDLDRCRPEKIMEMLEAISFLAASGKCFVILGMALGPVEASIAHEFDRIARDVGKVTGGASVEPLDLARGYLEKVVNIEVPIGLPDEEHARKLLDANLKKTSRSPPRKASDLLKASSWVGGIAIALVTAIGIGRSLPDEPSESTSHANVGALQQGSPAPAGTASAPPNDSREADLRLSPLRMERVDGQYPVVSTDAGRPRSSYWPLLLVLTLFGAFFAYVRYQRRVTVFDSDEFVSAAEFWHPLVNKKLETPRKLKRFWNRVRYCAMQANEAIPDDILVAFAALQQFDPSILQSEGAPAIANASLANEFRERFAKIREDAQFAAYRDTFLALSPQPLSSVGVGTPKRPTGPTTAGTN